MSVGVALRHLGKLVSMLSSHYVNVLLFFGMFDSKILTYCTFNIHTEEWYQCSHLTFRKKTNKHISQKDKTWIYTTLTQFLSF